MHASADSNRWEKAVEAIYDCALDPAKWPAALEAIADTFGDVGGVLTYQRDDGRFVAIASPRLAEAQKEYNRLWHQHDVRSPQIAKRAYLMSDDTFTEQSLGIGDIVETHPFYTDFLGKHDLRWFAGTIVSPDPHTHVSICVQRSTRKPPFTDDERQLLAQLGRHAEKALRIGLRLIEAESWSHGLGETFSRLNMGLFLVDALGRVVFSNESDKRLCGGAVNLVNDRITATSMCGRQLHDIIEAAIDRTDLSDAVSRPVFVREEDSPSLAIYIIPLRAEPNLPAEPFVARARAIVLAFELRTDQTIDPSLIRDFLGLTLGEARMAALVASGISPRDASLKLGISEETARTVLKRVFAKAGVSRQNELAALVGKIIFAQSPTGLQG